MPIALMRRARPLIAAFVLAVAAGCSDDASRADADAGGGVDRSGSDARDIDTDLGWSDDAGEGDDVARRPGDTGGEWSWDIRGDGGDARPFSLQEVVPASGPVIGGGRVRVVGTGFEPGTRVFFGSREMQVDVTAGQMIGRAPAAAGPGAVTVKAIVPNGGVHTLVDGYKYVDGLQVDAVTPRRIPTDGGIEVAIRGNGFTADTAVSVDGTSASRVSFVDDQLIRAVVPPGRRGRADLRVTTRDASHMARQAVVYYAPLELSQVTPASGQVDGGEVVTVTGSGFSSAMTVSFGGQPASVRSVDPQASTATVVTPARPVGLVDVAAQNERDSAILPDAYLYRADDSPVLAALSPREGRSSGGRQVWLRGYGFDAAGLKISFGSASATIVDRGPTYAVVETPAGPPGPVDVIMSDASGTLDRVEDGFVYRRDLYVDGVSPASGPAAGGEAVTVTGAGFTGVERVKFGAVGAGFQVVSDTEILATTPAHGAGQVDVVLERGGLQGRLQDGYTFADELEVWGFEPIRGSIAGDTYVEMRGTGFVGDLKVRVGTKEAPVVQRVDAHNLLFRTPPHAVGQVDVAVEVGGDTADAPYPYEYFNPASRFGGASGGAVDGAVNVSVYANGGGPLPGAFVMLSTRADTAYRGITDANGQVTLSGPEVAGPQTVTAAAKGFSSATVERMNAENVTVFLSLRDPPPPEGNGNNTGGEGPPSGTISGEITTPGKLADPDNQSTYDMAVVGTTQSTIGAGELPAGQGSVVFGSGSYQIRSRVGDLAVVALCGVYNESDDEFDPQYMGVKRYMFVSDQQQYQADILCDIPLDDTATVKLVNPVYSPHGPDNNVVEVYWDFGFEGVFQAPAVGRGLSDVLQVADQPTPAGPISDMTFDFVGGSFTGDYSPSTQTERRDVADLSNMVQLPTLLDVPEPVSPTIGGVIEHRTISFEAAGPVDPDMYSVKLLNTQGRPLWQFIIPGDQHTIHLPTFPDFSFLPADQRPAPLATDRIYMTIIGIRGEQDFLYEHFSYRDLTFDAWRAYSLTRWSLLPPSQ